MTRSETSKSVLPESACSPGFGGPGSWPAAEVAGYLAAGVRPAVLRRLLTAWPHPGLYEQAWAADPHPALAVGLPAPVPPLRELPDRGFLLLYGTPEYPAALAAAPGPPLLLFGLGDPAALAPGVGVVGTREMTGWGAAVTRAAAAAAAAGGVPVHSGAARGVDTAAHTAALAAGAVTVAVLATGADVAYPAENADLLHAIVTGGGAVISEHPFGTGTGSRSGAGAGAAGASLTARLHARNRIIAGLSAVVVPAEASARSGSRDAVWAALAMDRAVIVALPHASQAEAVGAQVPTALAADRARSAKELTAMGAPDSVARAWAGRAPLASGVARTPGELRTLIRTALIFGVDR